MIFTVPEAKALVGLFVTFSIRVQEIFAQSYPGQLYTPDELRRHERCEGLFLNEALGGGTLDLILIVCRTLEATTKMIREIPVEGGWVYEVVNPDGRYSSLAPVPKAPALPPLQTWEG